MNILYLTNCDLKKNYAPTTRTIEMCRALRKQGCHILLVAPLFGIFSKKPTLSENFEIHFVRTPTAENFRTIFFLISSLIKVLYLIFTRNFTIMYVREMPFITLTLLMSRLANLRIYIEVNSLSAVEAKLAGRSKLWLWFLLTTQKINFLIAHKIFPLTKELKEAIRKRYFINERKLIPIPQPLDFKKFSPLDKFSCRSELGLENGKFILCYVGSFYPHHNIKLLLDSVKTLKNLILNLHIILVGDGKMRKFYELETERLGLSNFFTFKGEVDYSLIPKYICSSDICLHLTTPEQTEHTDTTLPIKVLEYIACCVPVIATGVNETLRNLVESSGHTFLTYDNLEENFVKSVLKIYNNPTSREDLMKGREILMKNQSSDVIARKLIEQMKD